jgi:3'-phosphoadenosine 5'-phosphosulfate sulfotransferase
MKAIHEMTEAELRRAQEKADVERNAVCDAMIEAGRGFETSSETLAKAKQPDADSLTKRFAASSKACDDLYSEMKYRLTYHGSLKRVRHQAT